MIHRIIGAFIIIASCIGFAFSIWHLIEMMKIPKDKRLWWGLDILMQLYYPIYILGVALGVYQFIV